MYIAYTAYSLPIVAMYALSCPSLRFGTLEPASCLACSLITKLPVVSLYQPRAASRNNHSSFTILFGPHTRLLKRLPIRRILSWIATHCPSLLYFQPCFKAAHAVFSPNVYMFRSFCFPNQYQSRIHLCSYPGWATILHSVRIATCTYCI